MIYEIIKKLSQTTKILEKEKILTENKDNLLLKEVFRLAYSSDVKFWIKNFESNLTPKKTESLDSSLKLLEPIMKREITGNKAREHLEYIFSICEEPQIIGLIIKKDLKCGVNTKLINKIWKGLLYEPPYCRCNTLSEKTIKKIHFPAFSQVKADGTYFSISVTKDSVEYMSRSGEVYDFLGFPDNEFKELARNKDLVFMGEALYLKDGIADRETGNGVIQKAGKNTITSDEANNIVFKIWDVVTLDEFYDRISNTPYKDRFEQLNKLYNTTDDRYMARNKISIIKTNIINSYEEALIHYNSCINDGEEGSIIKDFNALWKDHTSPLQIKIKIEFDVDLKIIGFNKGKDGSKYQNTLGSLICTSSDGLIQVDVSGFKEDVRFDIWDNKSKYLNSTVEITVFGTTKDKKSNSYSLYLPRFKSFRFDKNNCDSLKRILEIEESIKILKKDSK